MNHFKLIYILIIAISCTSNQHSTKVINDSTIVLQDTLEQVSLLDLVDNTEAAIIASSQAGETELYLNGIYEYVYPHNTEDFIENHYIVFREIGDLTEGWYYGTSDEFDEAREGYLPGFFVSKIKDLKILDDSLFFTVVTGYDKCFSESFPIGYIDNKQMSKSNEIWNSNSEVQILKYSGKLTGLLITMTVNGDTRIYSKRKNYFQAGIDNFDTTKCQLEPLLAINRNIDNLNDTLILDFLRTFSVTCENNIEFSQWSNELLFKVLNSSHKCNIVIK